MSDIDWPACQVHYAQVDGLGGSRTLVSVKPFTSRILFVIEKNIHWIYLTMKTGERGNINWSIQLASQVHNLYHPFQFNSMCGPIPERLPELLEQAFAEHLQSMREEPSIDL